MISIETDRLLLREFRPEDVDAYAEMCADPVVMRYLSETGAVLSREEAWRQMAMFAGHWVLRGFGTWALEERATRRFVGRAGLHYPEGWPDRELGWTLCRAFWGHGFATEAARAAATYAFETLGWSHVIRQSRSRNGNPNSSAGRVRNAIARGCAAQASWNDSRSRPTTARLSSHRDRR